MNYVTTETLIEAVRNAWDKNILICQHADRFSFSDYMREDCFCAIGTVLNKDDFQTLEDYPCDSVDFLAEESIVTFENPEFADMLMRSHDAVVDAKKGAYKDEALSEFRKIIQK